MSCFQLQEWWSVKVSQNESFDFGAMAIGNVDNASPASDKILIGSQQGILRMYNPSRPEFRVEDLVLEEDLSLPILQLLVGQFVPSSDTLAVAVLHPRKLVVYEIIPKGTKEKKIDYCSMVKAYHHDLGVEGLHFTAYNMACGCFGGVQGREMFIVQSMDGKLQILEQSANAFCRQLVDYLVPGPIQYLPKIDAFVTVNQANQAECYRYHVLASSQAAEARAEAKSDGKGTKKGTMPAVRSAMNEWSLQIGEPARQILVGSFSSLSDGPAAAAGGDPPSSGAKQVQVGAGKARASAGSELLVVCDKSLFLIRSESGAVIQQRRIERSDVSCVCAYPVAASATPGGSSSQVSTNFLLAGMDGTIQVYAGFQLLWAARSTTTPVQMAVSSHIAGGSQPGLIVTLDDEGLLQLSYLGTKPASTAVTSHVRDLNYDQIDAEHRALLQRIRDSQSDDRSEQQPEKLVVRVQMPKGLDLDPRLDLGAEGSFATGGDTSGGPVNLPDHLVSLRSSGVTGGGAAFDDHNYVKICVKLFVCFAGELKKATDVTLVVTTPSFVHAVPRTVVLAKVKGVRSTPQMVKLYLFASKLYTPADLTASVVASYTSPLQGEPRSISVPIHVPLMLACRPKLPVKSAKCKVVLDTGDYPSVPLTELFDDFLYSYSESGMDVREAAGGAAQQAMGFQLWCPVAGSDGSTAAIHVQSGGSGSGSGSGSSASPAVVSVLVSKNAGRYRLQSDSFPALYLVCKEVEQRLTKHLIGYSQVDGSSTANAGQQQQQQQQLQQMSMPPPVPIVKTADNLPLEDLFAAVQTHFNTRLRIATLEAQLNDRAHQYRLVQKRLLVRFKDRNPTPLAGLDHLLSETQLQLSELGDRLEAEQQVLQQQGAELLCFARLFVLLCGMKFSLSYPDRLLLTSYLCPAADTWEENVDAAVTHLLKTSLAKHSKDSVSLAVGALERPSSIDPLKKKINILVDRLEKVGSLSGGGSTPLASVGGRK